MIIIFAGSIGRFPVGGHAWVDLQYLLGFATLGHDVYYVEDCGEGSYVYNWETEQETTDLDYPTSYLRACLEAAGLAGRWIYRAGETTVGMEAEELIEVCARADLLIVRGSPLSPWRPEYDRPRRRAYIDSDPGFTQISIARGSRALAGTVERCDHCFTVGQRLGAADCPVPTAGRLWHRMLPPVSLPHWPPSAAAATHFTAVLQWHSYREVTFAGVTYGNKDREFPRFIDLPRRTSQPFRLALTGGQPGLLESRGWDVVPGWAATFRPDDYQRFVAESRAELGVAKHGYVAGRTGWFSDRSACYLSCGRPVLVQETGLDEHLTAGGGVVTFRDAEEAIRGVEAINADYEGHSRAARRLAEEHLAAARVLPRFLEEAMS